MADVSGFSGEIVLRVLEGSRTRAPGLGRNAFRVMDRLGNHCTIIKYQVRLGCQYRPFRKEWKRSQPVNSLKTVFQKLDSARLTVTFLAHEPILLPQEPTQVQKTIWTLLFLSCVTMPSLGSDGKPNPRTKPRKPYPAFATVEDDPRLPRVLLIGDSISIGYTVPVRKLLAGKANVHRIPTNGGPTTRGLEQIDKWLGKKPWDVIHFNWGLHDLYLTKQADSAEKSKGHRRVSLEDYEKNLRQLVARLKQTGARLIWCSTTPVPPGAKARVVGDAVRYNEVARKVMQENHVTINDLYAFSKPILSKIQRKANVHFTPSGSEQLARQVAKSIENVLAE